MRTPKLETLRAELSAAVEEFNASERAEADPVARLEMLQRLRDLRARVKSLERVGVRGVVSSDTFAPGVLKAKGVACK